MFWEDKSKRRIVLISVALIMLLAVFFWFKKNSKTVSNFLVTKGLDYIKKDLDGELLYQGLNSNIENGEFKIHFDSLEILDKQRIQALEAQKLDIVWSLANILGREQVINHISARSLLINAIRDNSGKWNLTGILRPKKKRFSFKFKNVDFPNVIVDLQDIMSFKEIKHNVISIKLESKNLEDIYQVWILANPPKAYNDSTLVDDYSSLTAIDSQNFIRVKGEIDLSEQNRVLQKNKLTFHIANLNMLNLNFLLDLINNYKSQEINSLFNKYAHEANLNLFGQIDSSNKDSKKIFFKSVIYNLYHIPQLLLDIDLDYMSDKDLIFKKFIMQFFNSSIQLSGRINNFDNDNENYQIKGSIKSLNVLDLLNKIDELRQAQYLAFIGLLEGLKIAENMNLTLDFSGNKSGYNIVSAIDLANQKDLIIKGSINSKLLTINQFTVPIDFAKVSMSGQYNLDSKFYDLNLESSDLPLDKAKLFLQNFEFFNKYSEYFAKALVGGYSSFSLNIKKSSQGESFPVLLNGFIKFAKTFYYTEALKIPIQNLTTKLDIKDNYIDIPQLSSFIGTSYIEAKGNFKLGQLNSLNLELASPKINLASFNSSEFFNSLTEKHRLANLTGIIDNFYFKVSQNTDYKAYGDLNDISFVVDDAFRIKNLNGKTAYDHKSLKFKNLKFKINDSSQVNLLGQIDDDFKLPKLVITAKDLDLGEISKFDFLSSQYHLAPNSGKLDADLFLNGQKLVGSVDLKHCDFSFKDHPKFKYPFTNLNGQVFFSDDLAFKNVKGNYGNSKIEKMIFVIDDYRGQDKYYDLHFNGQLMYSELEYLVPKGISQFIGAKGLLPTKLKIKGSKNKLIIDTDLLISGLDDFKFSNWLDINESLSQEIKIKAQTTVTPQTIYSKNSTISFAKNSDSIVINSDFQVNDWSLKNKINYRAFFDSGSAAKNGQVLLDIVEPHLLSLKPLNLDIGKGFFTCDNQGDDAHRQTNCLFRAITPTIARKYGIGDLRANIVNVNLLSFDHKPLYVQTRLRDGDWNGIGYKRILFDMDVNGNLVSVNNLVAKLKNSGTVRADTTFDIATLESTFKIDGDQVSANELIQGIWGFGAEVPEGKISGSYRGQTKGILPNEMFFNLKGQANLIVKDGKLSQLKTMQKLLTAINTIKNFDINNVFQVLVTYQGGHFNQVISSLNYDLGKISTEKLLLKSDSIELDLKGYVDYSKDRLEISGRGLIPKHSKSILQTVGIGPANLGNLFSLTNLGATDSKRLFSFSMIGPATNMDKTVESIKSSFKWKED